MALTVSAAICTRRIEQQHVATARLQRVNESATAALHGVETVELVYLPQRISDVTGAVSMLTQQESSFDSQLPMREILGLNEALKRTCGALVDNLAKLSQLDEDITQAEQELRVKRRPTTRRKSAAYRSCLIGCATSVRFVWTRPLQTVVPSVHISLASERQLSGH